MIPLLLFLLGCFGIYVGIVQTAFVAVMRFSLRMVAEGSGKRSVRRYLEDPSRLFIPSRLLLGLINVLAAVLLVSLIGVGQRPHGWLWLLLSMAAFILVTEHLVPQLVVRRNPPGVLDVLLPSFQLIAAPLQPLVVMRNGSNGRERPAARSETEDVAEPSPAVAAEADAAQEVAEEAREERRLFISMVEFQDRLAREVMTPRPDIVAIRADATIGELDALFRDQQYSRLPVYRESLDNILGFVNVKDLLLDDPRRPEDPITPLVRPAHVVPETKLVPELLKEMQQAHVQSALVVDEYGGTAGLVTMEDLVEELVGEIRDEYDVEAEPIVEEQQGTFIFSGKVDVDKLAERLGVDVEREGFETVGGYLLSRLGRVPQVGEIFDVDDLHVEVLEAEHRRILKVRVRRALVPSNE
jgi:putative hemolysin